MTRQPESRTDAAETTLRARADAARQAAARHKPRPSLEDRFSRGREYAERFDFEAFSVEQLARLYEVAKSPDDYWCGIGKFSFCVAPVDTPFPPPTPIGWFVEFETDHMSFLRDRCVRELAARSPANDGERDSILSVRIAHELPCNGKIEPLDAPGLLIEAFKAWG